jgi:hypothetical protein
MNGSERRTSDRTWSGMNGSSCPITYTVSWCLWTHSLPQKCPAAASLGQRVGDWRRGLWARSSARSSPHARNASGQRGPPILLGKAASMIISSETTNLCSASGRKSSTIQVHGQRIDTTACDFRDRSGTTPVNSLSGWGYCSRRSGGSLSLASMNCRCDSFSVWAIPRISSISS